MPNSIYLEGFFASLRMTTMYLNAVILSGGEAGVEESLYILV